MSLLCDLDRVPYPLCTSCVSSTPQEAAPDQSWAPMSHILSKLTHPFNKYLTSRRQGFVLDPGDRARILTIAMQLLEKSSICLALFPGPPLSTKLLQEELGWGNGDYAMSWSLASTGLSVLPRILHSPPLPPYRGHCTLSPIPKSLTPSLRLDMKPCLLHQSKS